MGAIVTMRGYESIGTAASTTIGTAITQLVAASTACGAVWLKSMPGNSGTIYVGNSNVGTASGFPLVASDVIVIEVADASRIWAIASAASQDLRWFTLSRY